MVWFYELSVGRGLINFEPQEAALAMETYHTWARLFELQRYYSWIVDRFHLSTMAYQAREHDTRYDFTWLEQRLRPLGFRLILLTRSAESFAAAREQRLKVSGNPSQYDDLKPFLAEQEELRKLARASSLPLLELDMTDNDVASAADRVAEWMEATGGLTLNDGHCVVPIG
jgi:hypothetical protein